jgi:N-acetylneuraminic acid mutarotase
MGGRTTLNAMVGYLVSSNSWTTLTSMPTSRRGNAAAALNGGVFALGGSNGAPMSSVDRYDVLLNTWSACTPMQSSRSWFAAAVLDGFIYALGGYSSSMPGNIDTPSVERYNPTLDTWSSVANMTISRREFAAAALNGSIYAIGGYTTTLIATLASVERFDPETNTWTLVASMSTARKAHAAVAVGRFVYVIGGTSDNYASSLSSMDRYDPETNTWLSFPSMAQSRFDLAAVVVGAADIYVLGGSFNATTTDLTDLSSVEMYGVAAGTWTTVAGLPFPRQDFAAAAL